MKYLKGVVLFFSILTVSVCLGQTISKEKLNLSDFKFQSIFGTTHTDGKATYCLLGLGYYRGPHSADSDSLIYNWLEAHPKSLVIPISSTSPATIKDPDSKIIYCWVIDNKDTLNNYLIQNGCFPGRTMIRPNTWEEMKQWEKEFYKEANEKVNVEVFVDKEIYDNFILQIKSAQLSAQEKKLGIWKKP